MKNWENDYKNELIIKSKDCQWNSFVYLEEIQHCMRLVTTEIESEVIKTLVFFFFLNIPIKSETHLCLLSTISHFSIAVKKWDSLNAIYNVVQNLKVLLHKENIKRDVSSVCVRARLILI